MDREDPGGAAGGERHGHHVLDEENFLLKNDS